LTETGNLNSNKNLKFMTESSNGDRHNINLS